MKLSFFEQNNKTSIEKIKEFESIISLELPNDYVKFLLEYNGGLLDSNNIKIHIPPEKGKKKRKNVDSCVESLFSLESLLENYDDSILIDENKMMFIGNTSAGSVNLCFSKDNYGKIYFSEPIYCVLDTLELINEQYLKISDSFDEFLNKIKFIQD